MQAGMRAQPMGTKEVASIEGCTRVREAFLLLCTDVSHPEGPLYRKENNYNLYLDKATPEHCSLL